MKLLTFKLLPILISILEGLVGIMLSNSMGLILPCSIFCPGAISRSISSTSFGYLSTEKTNSIISTLKDIPSIPDLVAIVSIEYSTEAFTSDSSFSSTGTFSNDMSVSPRVCMKEYSPLAGLSVLAAMCF